MHQPGGAMSGEIKRDGPKVYQIKFRGHLETRWAIWFDELTFSHEPDGTTTLYGRIPDQAALHSILHKIRDLNLVLLEIKQIESYPGE